MNKIENTKITNNEFENVLINIKNNNISKIRDTILNLKDVDMYDDEDNTLLHHASKNKNIPIILLLIRHGANIFQINKKNKSSFDYIIQNIFKVQGINSLESQSIIDLIKKQIQRKKLENIVATKIFNLINNKDVELYPYYLSIIDLTKITSVQYYSSDKVLRNYNFADLAYLLDDKIFYSQLIEFGFSLPQTLLTELKKTSYICGRNDWLSFLSSGKYFDLNSEEVIETTNEIFSYC